MHPKIAGTLLYRFLRKDPGQPFLEMTARGWIFAAMAIAVIAGSGMATLSFTGHGAQSQNTSTTTTLALQGTVDTVVSECAPKPQATSTCAFFDVTVLRATDGYTYSFNGLPSGTNWVGQCVKVSGIVGIPSSTGLSFIHGDLTVLTIAMATGC
jgi:hypothetical protein